MLPLTDFSKSTIKSVETASFGFVGKGRLPNYFSGDFHFSYL